MRSKTLAFALCTLFFLSLVPVHAADEDTITITVTVKNFLLTIYEDDGTTDYTTYAIGAVDMNSTTVMADTDCLCITNESNVACDLQFKCSNSAPDSWTPAGATGEDQFILMVICESTNASSPTSGDFDTTNDDLNASYQTCTATLFAGDTDGASVASDASIYGYFRFDAPSSLSVDAPGQQTITFYAKAVDVA